MSSAVLSIKNHFLHVFDTRTGQSYDLPIDRNTIRGSDLARIQAPAGTCHDEESLYNHTGLRLFDPGFENVAVMESSITFADGRCDPPALEYRGYTFSELGYTCDFEDMTYLMIWGQKPSSEQKLWLRRKLGEACLHVPQEVVNVVQSFPPSTPFYPMLLGGLSAYIGAHPTLIPAVTGQNIYHGNMENTDNAIFQTIAAYAVVLGITYCHREGLDFPSADPDAPFLNNIFRFLHLGDDPAVIAFIDHLWVQGCDHELNNSAAALLHAASTLADPISCVMSALSSSYGLLHLGAADHAYRMMERIGCPENVASFLAAAKLRRQRVAGIGHRVYKGRVDPRIAPMKRLLAGLKAKGLEDSLVYVAYEIERQVNEDPYFIERRLQANIDLYWPFAYTALGISSNAVLPMFLASRMVGLMAHWREAMSQRIKMWRPQQLFIGERARNRPRPGQKTSISLMADKNPKDTTPLLTGSSHIDSTVTCDQHSCPGDETSRKGSTTERDYDFDGLKPVAVPMPMSIPMPVSTSPLSTATTASDSDKESSSGSVTTLELELDPGCSDHPRDSGHRQEKNTVEIRDFGHV